MSSITTLRPPILPLYDVIMKGDDVHPDEIIRSIINEITNKVCHQFNNKNKLKKTVCFTEDTKKHDGPQMCKQITETLVYAFFEKQIIRSSQDIKSLLYKKYGDIKMEILTDIKELMNNLLDRIKQINPYDRKTSINLFKDITGSYGLKLGKIHEPFLKRLIRMFARIIYI